MENEYAGMSPYNYGNCNPITFNDPSGMSGEDTVTVKKGQGVWDIAQQQLGKKASNRQINDLKENIIKWNGLDDNGSVETGQKLYVQGVTAGDMILLSEKVVKENFSLYNPQADIYNNLIAGMYSEIINQKGRFSFLDSLSNSDANKFINSFLLPVWEGHKKMARVKTGNYNNHNAKIDAAKSKDAKVELILQRDPEAQRNLDFFMFTVGEVTEFLTAASGFSTPYSLPKPAKRNLELNSAKLPPARKSNEYGKMIGWGERNELDDVLQTMNVTKNLTRDKVQLLKTQGLPKSWVESQLSMYNKAVLKGGIKLNNAQLMPRKALMEKILNLWN